MAKEYNILAKKIITLVTESQAKVGLRFVSKFNPSCRKCPLYKICIGNLEATLTYQVVNVRRVRHKCPVTGVSMVVVEVVPLPIKALVPATQAVEGMNINCSLRRCERKKCKLRKLCVHPSFRRVKRFKIVKVFSPTITCEKNITWKLALLQPLL